MEGKNGKFNSFLVLVLIFMLMVKVLFLAEIILYPKTFENPYRPLYPFKDFPLLILLFILSVGAQFL
jgi:hypothetical protein